MLYDNIKNVIYESSDLIDIAYRYDISEWDTLPIKNDTEVELYNSNSSVFDYPQIHTHSPDTRLIKDVDYQNQNTWLHGPEFDNINILEYCLNRCNSDIETDRVLYEYDKFESYNMVPLLKYIYWLIQTMSDNDILWGVGRGSSVSSFILYILGIHCINPIIYNIDCNEFFKEEDT